MPKITKLCLNVLKLCIENCGFFFPDTVYCTTTTTAFTTLVRGRRHQIDAKTTIGKQIFEDPVTATGRCGAVASRRRRGCGETRDADRNERDAEAINARPRLCVRPLAVCVGEYTEAADKAMYHRQL